MVLEWNDEFGKVILREQVNSEPCEVIDIVDLLEAWQFYKASKTQTEVEVISCPIIDDDAWIYKDEPPIELQEAYFQGYQEGKEHERRQLEARFNEQTEPQLTPNYCGTCKHREVPCGDLPCDVCHGYNNYEPKTESKTEEPSFTATDFGKGTITRYTDEPQTEVETMSCEECKYYRIGKPCEPFLNESDCRYEPKTEPQTEMEKSGSRAVQTARCLNCHNAKACKENHWEGCRFEPIEDEPQTERPSCETCRHKGESWSGEHCYNCYGRSEYEPQTERSE